MIDGIEVVDAWRIGPDSFASTGIMPDDTPIIPPGRESDAPVLAVLRERQRYAK